MSRGRVCIAAIFRCEARLGLEDFGYARHDASECVRLDRGDPGSVAVENEEHTPIEFVINDSGRTEGD